MDRTAILQLKVDSTGAVTGDRVDRLLGTGEAGRDIARRGQPLARQEGAAGHVTDQAGCATAQ